MPGDWTLIRPAWASPDGLRVLWQKFRASPLSVRLARGLAWSLAGAALSRGFGVLGSIVVARILGISAFGELTLIQSTVGLFGTFAGLGLGITATKYIAELRDAEPERCGQVINLVVMTAVLGSLIACGALLSFAPGVATQMLGIASLAHLLRYSCPLVFFSTLQGVYLGALAGFEAFRRVAQVNWIGGLLGVLAMVLCAWIWGLPGAIWGTGLQMALSCGLAHFALQTEASKGGIVLFRKLDWNDSRILWRFSLPAFLSSILVSPANWACNLLLVHQSDGLKEVALLSAANQWKNFLSFLPMMMTSVLIPMLSNLWRAGRKHEFNKLVRRNLFISAAASMALGLPLAFIAPKILRWYGTEFIRGVPVFLWAIAGTLIVAANNLFSRVMQSRGQAWKELSFSLLWALVLVAACWFLIPHYRAVGVTIAHFLAAVALGFWQWHMISRMQEERQSAIVKPAPPLPCN